jgi:hypothetical protein
MKARARAGAVALVTAVGTIGALAAAPAATAGGDSGVHVITRGLDGPFGLQAVHYRSGFVVAENDTGEVTRVSGTGVQHTIFNGADGVAGVAAGHGKVFAVLGGGDETGPPPSGPYPPSSLLKADAQGEHVSVLADLAQYELDHNPDGQVQFVKGKPVDALSNPFSMTLAGDHLLVADGGANDVLRVNRYTGRTTTFFAPPTVTDVKACLADGAQNNPGTVGCDPVPTGVAVVKGSVYVSTLGAEVPGAGRVYKLNAHSGEVQRVWKGLTAPTGVAVSPGGSIYVSEVFYGAPAGDGPPPAGFDPSSVGRITKISPSGHITHAAVTMPTGLDYERGHLYSSAWSVASFLGIEHAGQIVSVSPSAFH